MPDGIAGLDPMSEEYQRRLEEHIRQKAVEENFQLALEHNPELVAGSVFMLYVPMEVNGRKVKVRDRGTCMPVFSFSIVLYTPFYVPIRMAHVHVVFTFHVWYTRRPSWTAARR
jgi:hypothetical protein